MSENIWATVNVDIIDQNLFINKYYHECIYIYIVIYVLEALLVEHGTSNARLMEKKVILEKTV